MPTNTTQKAAILATLTKPVEQRDVFSVKSLATKTRIQDAMKGTEK